MNATFEEIVGTLKETKAVSLNGVDLSVKGVLILEDPEEDLIITPNFGGAAFLSWEVDLDDTGQAILVPGKHPQGQAIFTDGELELPDLWKLSQSWTFTD